MSFGFEDALRRLKSGLKVQRKSWIKEDFSSFLTIDEDDSRSLVRVSMSTYSSEPNLYRPIVEDLLAEDWVGI